MTYTTLIITVMTATFPLSAFAKDVKGIDCYKLQEQGYKVLCPDKAPAPKQDDADLDKAFGQKPDDQAAADKANAEENGEDADGPPGEDY